MMTIDRTDNLFLVWKMFLVHKYIYALCYFITIKCSGIICSWYSSLGKRNLLWEYQQI